LRVVKSRGGKWNTPPGKERRRKKKKPDPERRDRQHYSGRNKKMMSAGKKKAERKKEAVSFSEKKDPCFVWLKRTGKGSRSESKENLAQERECLGRRDQKRRGEEKRRHLFSRGVRVSDEAQRPLSARGGRRGPVARRALVP